MLTLFSLHSKQKTGFIYYRFCGLQNVSDLQSKMFEIPNMQNFNDVGTCPTKRVGYMNVY